MKCINTKLAGVTKRNEDGRSRQEIIEEELYPGLELYLWHDCDNEYDSNAIEVSTSVYGDVVGYLSREMAAKIAPLMDSGHLVLCTITDITGDPYAGESRGVNVKLIIYTPEETEAMAKVSAAQYKATSPAIKEPKPMPTQTSQQPTWQPYQPPAGQPWQPAPGQTYQAPRAKSNLFQKFRKLPAWAKILIILLIIVLLFFGSAVIVAFVQSLAEFIAR